MTIYTALLCSFSKFEPVSCSCKLLTIASWSACRFVRSQVKYSHIFKKCKNFPQFVVIHTVKGFSIVSEAEVDVFLEFLCFLYNPMNVDLISGSSAFSKPNLYIWKFSVIIMLMPSLKDFEHNLTSMQNVCNCSLNILSHYSSLGLKWKLIFSSPVATAEFSKFADIWVQCFNIIF